MRTDHLGFIVPAGKKLKPIRQKVRLRDCREHRKLTLYLALDAENWRDVVEAENIEDAVQRFELKILSIMNKCMPLRTVSISSRAPTWMTPLVKYMLRRKSRVSVLNADRQREQSKRISEVISDNRRLLLDAKPGSRECWRNVDVLSQRCRCSCKRSRT